jgi:hypothetical protein
MTTTEDLRRTLADNASRAPEGVGLAAAVVAGAARVRRRRRFGAAGAAALVTLALGAGFALVRPGQATSPAPPMPTPRFHQTVELAPGGTYMITHRESDGRNQFVRVRLAAYTHDALIRVAEPGTYDARDLLAAERITVAGHPAYYRARDGIVGWPDSSDAWVLVSSAASGEELLRFAEHVRTTPPRPMRAPVRFTEVPPTLRLATASVDLSTIPPYAGVGFDRAGEDVPRSWPSLDGQVLNVWIYPRTTYTDFSYLYSDGPPVTVARHEARYSESAAGAILTLRTDTCMVRYIATDRALLPFEVLRRIADTARYADCTRPETWFNLP